MSVLTRFLSTAAELSGVGGSSAMDAMCGASGRPTLCPRVSTG